MENVQLCELSWNVNGVWASIEAKGTAACVNPSFTELQGQNFYLSFVIVSSESSTNTVLIRDRDKQDE